MANAREAIPSVRVKVSLIPPRSTGRPPLPLGLVEQLSMPSEFQSELFSVIGSPYAPDGVVNFESGRVQLNSVYQNNSDILGTIAPRIAEFQGYERFDVLTTDPKDNQPITLAKGCLPQQLGFDATPGRAARLTYSGICQLILRGSEITQDSGSIASMAA